MLIIKRYFLLVLLMSPLSVSAMEFVDDKFTMETIIEDIADKIDKDHLGLSECLKFTHIKPFVGSCMSFFKGFTFWTTEKHAQNEMKKIKGYIESYLKREVSESKNIGTKYILHQLIQKHWYVFFLMDTLMYKKVAALGGAKGSTIDVLYTPDSIDDDLVEREVLSATWNELFKISRINDPLFMDTFPEIACDRHFTVLYGPNGDIDSLSLAMSSDGKYLSTTDCNNKNLAWEMKTASPVNFDDIKNIMWFGCSKHYPKHGVIDQDSIYYARIMHDDIKDDETFFLNNKRSGNGIILFQRPQKVSHLCEMALYNSKDDKKELEALLNSKTMEQVEGFPKDTFKQIIQKHIEQLTLKEEKKDL